MGCLLTLAGSLAACESGFGQPAFRGVWADAFHDGFRSQAQIDALVSRAVTGNYNAILAEVLAYQDQHSVYGGHGAYWNSSIVPKALDIVGDIDPLSYLITQAHAQGIEVHVWLVAFRVSLYKPSDAYTGWPPAGNSHIQDEWLMVVDSDAGTGVKPFDDGATSLKYVMDPGNPEVQEYLISIVQELVTNYAIDGVHWDYIRYTDMAGGYPIDLSYTKSGLARFQQITGYVGVPLWWDSDWGGFRRRGIDELVRRARAEIASITSNPSQPLRHTAALITFGGPPSGTDFTTTDAYALYSNWAYWLSQGWLDAGCPMNYKREHVAGQAADYRGWVDDALVWGAIRHIYAGQGAYLNTQPNSITQMSYALGAGADGTVTYSYFYPADNDTDGNPDNDWTWYPYVATNLFTSPVATPTMPWRDPATATEGTVWGRVTQADTGEPIDDATVQVVGFPAVQTDGNGYYVRTLVSASGSGTAYNVTADKTGYVGETARPTVPPGGIVQQDFALAGPCGVMIADFDGYTPGLEVLFRHPRYSGSTSGMLETTPDNSEVVALSPSFSGANAGWLEWKWLGDDPSFWMRATTHQAPNIPNPTIELDKPVRVRLMAANGPVWVTLGIRETGTTAAPGENGGTTGTIEWVGATTKHGNAPQGKLLEYSPNLWQTLIFDPRTDPILPFTGDGVLSTPTNRGTLECLAFTSYGWAGPVSIYIDDVEQLCDVPRLHVAANAAPGGDGQSWGTAYQHLADALDAATWADGEIAEIWVKAGVYHPDDGVERVPGDRSASFSVPDGVGLYGGFAGTETLRTQRDPTANVTILSGDLNDDDATTGTGENSYHVLLISVAGPLTTLDGFTITGGNANGGGDDAKGGGMYNYGNLVIRDCVFMENAAANNGGGVYSPFANLVNPTLIGCEFFGNTAGGDGGGIYTEDGWLNIVNTVFAGNSAAGYGGGLYAGEPSDPRLSNCSFGWNSADTSGGGAYLRGDGDISNSIAWGNTAGSGPIDEQQIRNAGAGLVSVTYSCIQDADPDDGTVPFGGGFNNNIDDDPRFLDSANGDLTLKTGSPCVDAGANDRDVDGLAPGSQPLPATDIDGNTRILDGDGDSTATVDMGAVESQSVAADSDLDAGETIVLYPSGDTGDPTEDASVRVTNVSASNDATVSVVETIGEPYPNGPSGYSAFGKTLTITSSLADGEFKMTISIPFTADDLGGEDPLSIDLAYYDGGAGPPKLAVAGNTANSPGKSGPVGDRFPVEGTTPPTLSTDLGDYGVFWNPSEQRGFVWCVCDHLTPFIAAAPLVDADYDDDGDVDLTDYGTFLSCYNGPNNPPLLPGCAEAADYDGDGDVDLSDYGVFLGCYNGPAAAPGCL